MNVVFIIISIRSRILASLLTFILAMLIIPMQVYLGIKLYRLQVEAARVVTYAYEYKINNGQFPNNLSEYKFVDPDMKNFISLLLAGESKDVLVVNYWVISTDIGYWYSSESGWNYYPD